MAKLLMISGYGAADLDSKGAFFNMLEEFHKHWDRIDIVAPATNCQRQVASYFGNVFVHLSPWVLLFQPWFILKKGREIYKEQKFDIVTVHEYPPFYNGLGAYFLWRKIKVPYILEIMHIPGYPKAATLKEWCYKHLSRFVLACDANYSKAVRVINQHETPAFLESAGVPRNKICYIPAFYINTEIFRPTGEEKKYDCIFVGRLAANKGVDLFVDAVKLAGASALIVGDGPLREEIALKIENLKLQDRIKMCGWARDSSEVASLMNRSRVLVMTSYNEGGPRVVLEAMACGVPVIATRVGVVPDIISVEFQCGWSADDISAKIKAVLHAPPAVDFEKIQKFEYKASVKSYAEWLKGSIL